MTLTSGRGHIPSSHPLFCAQVFASVWGPSPSVALTSRNSKLRAGLLPHLKAPALLEVGGGGGRRGGVGYPTPVVAVARRCQEHSLREDLAHAEPGPWPCLLAWDAEPEVGGVLS